jgi:hypothetical protein
VNTTVVNLKTDAYDVKICRRPNGSIPDPPNPGCFGNPFPMKNQFDDEEREKVIALYREYFEERIENDPAFRAAILTLRGKRLACFCAPKPCHGDVIKEWLDNNA